MWIKTSKKNTYFKLVTLTENILINKKVNGIKLELNSEKAFKKTDIIIDFTVPCCTLEILKIAHKNITPKYSICSLTTTIF